MGKPVQGDSEVRALYRGGNTDRKASLLLLVVATSPNRELPMCKECICNNAVKLCFHVNLAAVGRTAWNSPACSGLKNKTNCTLSSQTPFEKAAYSKMPCTLTFLGHLCWQNLFLKLWTGFLRSKAYVFSCGLLIVIGCFIWNESSACSGSLEEAILLF